MLSIRKLILSTAFYCAAFVMFSVQAAKVDKPPADHVHAEKQCKTCHKSGIDIPKLMAQANNDCLRCHTEKRLLKGFLLENSPVTSSKEAEISTLVPEQPLSIDTGMRFQPYSKSSRIGDAPNKMVKIPAGSFIRGTNQRLPDEGPEHRVDLPAYFIDVFEVTNNQYKRFINATDRRSPTHFRNRTYPAGKADHPVTYVSWKDAQAYCQWTGKRLPTDKEWEKAGRGTNGQIFPWGDEFDPQKANTPVRWAAIGQNGDTTPVGVFAEGVSPYGLYDMTGNVWEWTASWYKAYPGNKTASESYGERYKVLKGGSWFDCSFYKCGLSAPLFNRSFFAIRTKNDTFGFRCAKDL